MFVQHVYCAVKSTPGMGPPVHVLYNTCVPPVHVSCILCACTTSSGVMHVYPSACAFAIGIVFDGAETNCGIARILGILG